jgi:hypothetical protein
VATWNDPTDVPKHWADAAHLDPETLLLLLESAHADCIAYLAPLDGIDPVGDAVTASMRLAEIYQARARFQAIKSAGNNQVGPDGVSVTVFPMDWQVQQLLRPKSGRPSIA